MDNSSRVGVPAAPRFGAARLGLLFGPGALALNLSLAGLSLAAVPLLAGAGVVAAGLLAAGPAQAQFGIGVDVTIAPPPLPVYEQPPLPGPGYIWTPGYWAWGDDGYFWVPGTWVEPPEVGVLWTPGYWGWNSGRYIFNAGYWGPTVGFYGGIDYGFGYGGFGYEGGFWRGRDFSYNRAVNNFGGVHITNVYEKTVVRNVNRVSFNGPGGIDRRPQVAELAAARARHIQPTPMQQQLFQAARQEPTLRASANHGHPPIAAVSRPGALHEGAGGAGAVRPEHAGPSAHPGAHPGGQRDGMPPLAQHGAPPHPMAPHGASPHPMSGHPQAPSHPMAPHPAEPRAMAPHAPMMHHSAEGGMAPHPMQPRPMAPHPMAPAPHAMAPHPMAPAPHAMAPHPGGAGGPHPEGRREPHR